MKIMHIEDELEYSETIQRRLKRDKLITIKYEHFEEAEDAYNKLQTGKKLPNLILLDLNLKANKMSGIEFLKKVKEKTKFCQIPIVVLSTSNSKKDINDAMVNHANSYFSKESISSEFKIEFGKKSEEQVIQFLQIFNRYWINQKEQISNI